MCGFSGLLDQPDSKMFVDTIPDRELEEIRERFEREKPDFDIEEFVSESFRLPEDPVTAADPSKISMEWYIDEFWEHLIRDPSEERERSTLLCVPHRYVIAGGRFRESYYWDMYFVAIGLPSQVGSTSKKSWFESDWNRFLDHRIFLPRIARSVTNYCPLIS